MVSLSTSTKSLNVTSLSSMSTQSSVNFNSSTPISSVESTSLTDSTSNDITETETSTSLVPSTINAITSSTSIIAFSSLFVRNSTSTNATASETINPQSQNTTAPNPPSFLSLDVTGDWDSSPDGDQEITPDGNQPSSIVDSEPAGSQWWDNLVETAVYTWIGPQMYIPPKFYNGKWYDFMGNEIMVPDSYILWGEKIPWPPQNWDGVSIPTDLGSPPGPGEPGGSPASSTAASNQVQTTIGETTIHTTENGQPTDVISSFTSLITKPPVTPSISTSIGTSTFVTTVNGKPTTTSVLFTSAWAIGPSETVTSVGTSFVRTVVDGTTTSVPKVFTTTKVTPGETFALFGRITTVSTVVNGTTSRVTVSVVVGTLVSNSGLPATNDAAFTEIIENGDGITFVVTNGMTKTLAVSGSIVDSAAFPTRTAGQVTEPASKFTSGTFVTEVAGQTGPQGASKTGSQGASRTGAQVTNQKGAPSANKTGAQGVGQTEAQNGSSQLYTVVSTGASSPSGSNDVVDGPVPSNGVATSPNESNNKTSNSPTITAPRFSLLSISTFFGVIGALVFVGHI
ncbi:hypothetical protein AA313_de0206268 [Arthrobotrys entomopaga]|nr:hypothetical protein AA313_de0206268 [Arthrobotrys entomopaga]